MMLDETYTALALTRQILSKEIDLWDREQHVTGHEACELHDRMVEFLSDNDRCSDCGAELAHETADGEGVCTQGCK